MLTPESSPVAIILINIAAWLVIHLGTGYIISLLPLSLFDPDSRWFSPGAFEGEGIFYERIFRVRAWKGILPDGGNFFGNGFKKRALAEPGNPEYYRLFARETCRAEVSHITGFFEAFLFFAWNHWTIALWMILYAVAFNIPCIIAQRFNRPRLKRMADLLEDRMGRAGR